MINFLQASEKDVSLIESIARQTWPNTFGEVMPEAQIAYMLDLIYNEEALGRQMQEGHIFLIITHNDEAVGYTSYELNYRAQAQLMIHKVYLLPTAQGLGIGKSTFDLLTRIAKDNHQQALTLKVFHKNEKAIAFYQKKGFQQIGTETTDIGNDYTIVDHVMRKSI